jgi:hypothetical protein
MAANPESSSRALRWIPGSLARASRPGMTVFKMDTRVKPAYDKL